MTRKNIWIIIATSLTVTLHLTIVLAEETPFAAAPLSAYPSLANPPIKPYDSVALLAIVNLINPPHLKLTRVPARLLDKRNNKPKSNTEISTILFKDLPHFDTPTFEDYPLIKHNNVSREISDNQISSKENWSSINKTADNSNSTLIKPKRRLEPVVIDEQKLIGSSSQSSLIFDTKETPKKPESLEKISGRSGEERKVNSTQPLASDYSYNYTVSDEGKKDVKSHSEARNGNIVTGEYSILEPDGYTRHVRYYSDPSSGFKARVVRIAPLKTNLI